MHQFFQKIAKYDDLVYSCNPKISLPNAYIGSGPIKAILLGADPTNSGIRGHPEIKKLTTVFGIGTNYETDFFSPQLINLRAINLSKENLFVQNVCRNYFTEETSRNSHWKGVAQIWIPILKEELKPFRNEIPVLVTAEIIMKVLAENCPAVTDVYNLKVKPPFYSNKLERNLYPLYRHPRYLLHPGKWDCYKNYLTNIFK